MAWQLINSDKHWQNGPVKLAELRQEHAMLVAMGNIAGANCVLAELQALEERWANQYAQHAPVYTPAELKAPTTYRELNSGDTQGM